MAHLIVFITLIGTSASLSAGVRERRLTASAVQCSTLCDPYLNLFRGIIPPIGGTLDLSPILAFIVLDVSSPIHLACKHASSPLSHSPPLLSSKEAFQWALPSNFPIATPRQRRLCQLRL